MERYFRFRGVRRLDYCSSQGCPFQCSFCADPQVYRQRWSGLAPARVVDELAEHTERYRLAEVFFNDDESEAIVFERYRDADAALEHFANISHLMEPLMATATVTGEVLGTPNETIRAQLGDGEPKLFTPWMTAHDETTPPRPG